MTPHLQRSTSSLSPRTRQVLQFIIDHMIKYSGISPTLEHLETELSIITSDLRHRIQKLVTAGHLQQAPKRGSYIVPGGEWMPPLSRKDWR